MADLITANIVDTLQNTGIYSETKIFRVVQQIVKVYKNKEYTSVMTNKQSNNKLTSNRRADLMASASHAERVAYNILLKLGYNVIRQYPINTGKKQYYADFYLPQVRTIIEIDGGYHFTALQRKKDSNRSQGLWRLGYHVLRLSNKDARNPQKIVNKLKLIK